MQHVVLAHHSDWPGFRTAARRLLQTQVSPEQINWRCASDAQDSLFTPAPSASAALERSELALPLSSPSEAHNPIHIPRDWLGPLQAAILHRDPQRLPRMYRLLWRYQHQRALAHDQLDREVRQLHAMAHAVTRGMHKMKAFVRFRPVQQDDGSVLHVAWFEPEHCIVDAMAPFFVKRFFGMRWAILTPWGSLRWDSEQLTHGPAAHRSQAPAADAGERLWLTYYAHTFNPARLKPQAMYKEMPRHYWANLPEAQLIAPLMAEANARAVRMVNC